MTGNKLITDKLYIFWGVQFFFLHLHLTIDSKVWERASGTGVNGLVLSCYCECCLGRCGLGGCRDQTEPAGLHPSLQVATLATRLHHTEKNLSSIMTNFASIYIREKNAESLRHLKGFKRTPQRPASQE